MCHSVVYVCMYIDGWMNKDQRASERCIRGKISGGIHKWMEGHGRIGGYQG